MLNDENDTTASIAIKPLIKRDVVARLAMKSQKMAKINTFSLPLGRIGYKLTSRIQEQLQKRRSPASVAARKASKVSII